MCDVQEGKEKLLLFLLLGCKLLLVKLFNIRAAGLIIRVLIYATELLFWSQTVGLRNCSFEGKHCLLALDTNHQNLLKMLKLN